MAESARKSRVCWLSWTAHGEQHGPRLVWHTWYDDALLVLDLAGEQALPGLAEAGTVEVTMRSKDTGGRLVGWTGSVALVDPEHESWEPGAAALLAVRLNLPDPAQARAEWRASGAVLRITPVDATEENPPGPLP